MAARTGRILLAEVILSLVDRVSGPGKAVSRVFKEVLADAKALGSLNVTGATRLTAAFRQMAAAGKEAQQSVAGIGRSRFFSTMATDATRAGSAVERVRSGVAALRADTAAPMRVRLEVDRGALDRARADIRNTRRDAQRPPIVPPAPPHGGGPGAGRPGGVGGGAAVVGGVVATNNVTRGGRYAVNQGAEAARETERITSQGATPGEIAAIQEITRRLSSRPELRSLDHVQLSEMARNLLANTGDYQKALEVLPEYARGRVALQTIAGPRAADKEMEDFSRFIDLAGRSRDPNSTRFLIDSFVRARQMDARAFNAQDFVNAMQTGGSAARGFSDQFLGRILPAFIAQQKGHRTGTDFMTAFQNFAMGRGTNATLEQQMDFFRDGSDSAFSKQDAMGLREGVTRDNRGRITSRGRLVDEALYLSNPYEWAKKNLVPRLVQEGALPEGYARGDFSQEINSEQRGTLNRRLNDLFSARRGSSLFSLMLGDMPQIEAMIDRIQKARGTSDVERTARNDPFVQFEGVMAQLRNVLQDLTKPILTAVLPALERFASGLNAVSNYIARNPAWAPYMSGGAALLGGGAALGGAWLTLRGIGAALGMGGGAGGSVLSGLGGMVSGAARFIPGLGLVIGGYAGGKAAGGAIETISDAAQGKHYTPRTPDDVAFLRGRAAELEAEIARIRGATHPSMQGQPNPALANLESELANIRNRIALGLQEGGAAAQDGGRTIGQGAVEGVRSGGSEAFSAGQSIGQAIMNGLRSAIGNVGGGSAPAAPAAPSPPGRALGGPVTAGHLYTVGESGPELFCPGANGSIIPNHANAASPVIQDGRSEGARYQGSRNTSVAFHGPLIGSVNVTGATAKEVAEQLGDEIRSAMRGVFSDSGEAWG